VKRVAVAPSSAMREGYWWRGGDTSPDYLGPLIEPEHEQAVAASWRTALPTPRSDWMC